MIYAVNKRTKEHRLANASNTSGWTSPYCNWSVVMADPDGWIEWDAKPGAECPLPHDADCDVRHEDGFVAYRVPAHQEKWSGVHAVPLCRIIAYRPVLDAKPEAPMPERGTDATTPRRPFLDSGRMWSTKPEAPVGPQPGDTVEVHNEPGHLIAYGEHVIGEEAEVKAVFHSGRVKVAAVEHQGGCYCFRVDMLREPRSAEERAVEDMARIIADGHDVYIGAHEAAQRLYRAGYKKE